MKELSIEQKAKAYDEAIKRAKEINDEQQAQPFNIMTRVFPELKESEDEGILRRIINIVDEYSAKHQIDNTDCIDWLEKQDEHANFINKIQIGDKVTRNEDGVLVNLSQLKRVAKPAENKGKHGMGISEATKQKLEDNLNEALEKETSESLNEFLDEQGEQKTADITDKIKEEYQKGWNAAMQQLPKEVDSQIWQIANNSAKTWEESFAILCATQKAYDKGKKDALKEQKPAWSEEDENMLENTIGLIEVLDRETKGAFITKEYIDFLKSLKDKYTWKPSERQKEALLWCVVHLGGADKQTLGELLEELNKL